MMIDGGWRSLGLGITLCLKSGKLMAILGGDRLCRHRDEGF